MEVSIERSGCISCGLCAAVCPQIFRIADDGLAEAYRQPDAGNEAEARQAAEGCPVNVIRAEE